MAEGNAGDDSVRRKPASDDDKAPWRTDRRARQAGGTKRASTTATTAARNEAPNVRRIRPEESPPELTDPNELGFRDTTVLDSDTPIREIPRSHKRKADSQTEPVSNTPLPPFDPNVSSLLLGLAEGMFAAAWGDEARFTAKERAMIQPPLGRILARMTPEDGAKFTAFADPVFLGAGLLIWGVRVWTLQQRAVRPTPQPSRPNEPVVQGMPASEVRTEHSPSRHPENGSANVNPQIASEWGSI